MNTIRGGDTLSGHVETKRGVRVEFDFRVLFWWEEQAIKRDSLVFNQTTNRRTFDQSRFERGIMNECLTRVDERRRGDLGERRWSEVLPFRLVPAMHAVYERRTGLSQQELMRFRDDVKAYYDPEQRGSLNYVAPPELLEFILLERAGTITRDELRRLSYSEFLKIYTIINILGGQPEPPRGAGSSQPGTLIGGGPGFMGSPGIVAPSEVEAMRRQVERAGQ